MLSKASNRFALAKLRYATGYLYFTIRIYFYRRNLRYFLKSICNLAQTDKIRVMMATLKYGNNTVLAASNPWSYD